MKIAKQYLSMIFVFAISICVPLCAQEDAINKQQVYGQALYERTCSIIDENDSSAQKTAENLVQIIMADQEIYVLLNIGKNEGFTVAELLGFAKTIAQENEDQEVVQILQNVEQEAAKNWFSKHPVITTMSALVIAAGGVFAYLQKDYLKQLFFDYLEKLGFGVKPTQTDAERLAAEQEIARIAAEQEATRLAAEQAAARLAAEQETQRIATKNAELTRRKEQEDADFWANAFKIERAKEAAKLVAEQEAEAKGLEAGQAEVERFDRALQEASMTNEEVAKLIAGEQAQIEEEKEANAEVNSGDGAETDSDSLSDEKPQAPEVNSEEPQVFEIKPEESVVNLESEASTERKLTVTPEEAVTSEEVSSEANEHADAADLAIEYLGQESSSEENPAVITEAKSEVIAEETIEEEHDRIAATLEEQFALASTDETDSEEENVLEIEVMGENLEGLINDPIIDGSETAGTEIVAEDTQVISEVTTETKSEVVAEENPVATTEEQTITEEKTEEQSQVDETLFWL